MPSTLVSEHFDVATEKSTLTFFVKTGLNAVHGKVAGLTGYVEAAWASDGSMLVDQNPRMHLEFFVEQMHSGNELKDHEMWKMIDSKRFPKISADLLTLKQSSSSTAFIAGGKVTLAGLARNYENLFMVHRKGPEVVVSGYLEIDVRNFGLKEKSILSLKVEPVVKAHLHMVTLARA